VPGSWRTSSCGSSSRRPEDIGDEHAPERARPVPGRAALAAREASWLYPAVYLLLAFTGIRVARKTYVVDMAEGDQRTAYVAVANTAIGVLLLITGAVSGALAGLGEEIALVFLAALGLLGVAVGRTLPEVGRR
jgi:hypothetical protein